MMNDYAESGSVSNKNHRFHIQFTHIAKKYKADKRGKHSKDKDILNDVDITLKSSQCILLTGENGCGKSTLLRIMAGLLKPDSGFANTGLQVTPWKRARKLLLKHVMYLYQEPYMFDGSVYRNLRYAVNSTRKNKKGMGGHSSTNQINLALKWADLEHRKETEAKCLSGGERQRVALAQAWLKQPSVLLLDEPTANMDDCSRHRTEELLCKFKQRGTAILIASHDLDHFHQSKDQRLLLENGMILNIDEACSGSIAPEMTNDNLPNEQNIPKNVTNFPSRFQLLKNRIKGEANHDGQIATHATKTPYDDK